MTPRLPPPATALLRQLFVFGLVGGLNTAFGYSVFLLLIALGLGVAPALAAATIVGIVFNFFTTGKLVFRNADRRALLPFALGYGATYLVNLVTLKELLSLGLSPPLAQAICLPLVVSLSFAINKLLVFERLAR